MKGGRASPSPAEDLAPYAGRWVARLGGRVIAQGGTPRLTLLAAKATRYKESPEIEYVPMSMPLTFSPLFERLRQIIPDDMEIYLVGGAVRDALLGRVSNDLDLVLPGDALKAARRLASRLPAAYFPLDEERGVARLIYTREGGGRVHLDFSALRGATLEEDLQNRDFTVNAMAVNVRQPQALLDPTGGAADLLAKRLRACSPTAMEEDPLRVVRAIRLAAAYGLHIQPETRQWMRAAVPALRQVSHERRRDELLALLDAPRPAASIRALDILGALPHLLPELLALKGVEQTAPHIHDVWQHTLDTVAQLERLLHVLGPQHDEDASANLILGLAVLRLGRYRQQIRDWLAADVIPERPLRPLLFLAALYHDVGKPRARQVEEDGGRVRFLEHEVIGARMVAARSRELRLSTDETRWLKTVVAHHMRPNWLSNDPDGPSRRAIYRFFRDTGAAGVGVVLIALADLLATYGPTLPQERWARGVDVARALLEAWWEQRAEQVHPPALLNGRDLIAELGVEPGPIIGEILECLREAQAVGEITTREAALELARAILEDQTAEDAP